MEESTKNQQSSIAPGKSKLRYPLRSAAKSKDEAHKSPEVANNSSSVASKRGRPPIMSRSVSVLELSGKDKKDAKPPRRLSIPAKSTVSPRQKSASNITPISEARARRNNGQERSDTPMSDVSRSSARRKFSVLSSASYWLSQVKLSESAAKHSISLGFFKLALEAGCESLQRLRDELKSYVRKHNLAELAETVRSLFESYEISETWEQLQVSETCSHVPEDGSTPSNEEVHSTCSTVETNKLKPKSLSASTQASSAKVSPKKENAHRTTTTTKIRASVSRNPVKPRTVTENGGNNIKKKAQRPGMQESNNGEVKIKKQNEKSVVEEVTAKPLDNEETLEENKENMDAPLTGEVSVTEEN